VIALTWQTIVLLAAAYFIGCIVGCLAHKLKGAAPVVERGDLVPAGASVPRETASAPFVTPAPAPVTAPPTPVQNAFRRADSDAPGAPAEPVAPTPRAAPREVPPPPPPAIQPPESAVEAVAAALAAPAPEAAPVRDDLTRIRAIDSALEAALNRAGVTRYSEIASWTSEQVKAISQQLGFTGRIERENWIEQAHILARGDETNYATKRAIAELMPIAVPPAPAPAPVAPPVVTSPDVASRAAFAEPRREAVAPVPAPVAAAAASGRNNLQRIGGISAEIENTLIAHGITRYSQIASWTREDVERVDRLLGSEGRVSRENWIEQAQILANGGATAYAREFDRHGGPPVAPDVPDVPPDLSGMVSVRSAAFRGADSVAAWDAKKKRDDLKRIRGIGVALETKLNALGITTYRQIADWTAAEVATVSKKLGLDDTIERDNWIQQAAILAGERSTVLSRAAEYGFTPPPATPVPVDVPPPASATAEPIRATPPADRPTVVPASATDQYGPVWYALGAFGGFPRRRQSRAAKRAARAR
jgi:predicted flap endonuclease-1-like 5' DNA nuclease